MGYLSTYAVLALVVAGCVYALQNVDMAWGEIASLEAAGTSGTASMTAIVRVTMQQWTC